MKMKFLFTAILVTLTIAVFSQAQYEVSYDTKHPGVKILKGIINKQLLTGDTSFNWYVSSQKIYNPSDTSVVGPLQRNKNVSYIIFGGTWCEDTQFILPKFFKLQEKAGIPDDHITFFGVSRDKQTLGNIAAAMNITNVPTIIVMKNGKEAGRVVEYGTIGKWDKELADIVGK
jgi:Thiol-disulfide isomerase and thioredoxins